MRNERRVIETVTIDNLWKSWRVVGGACDLKVGLFCFKIKGICVNRQIEMIHREAIP